MGVYHSVACGTFLFITLVPLSAGAQQYSFTDLETLGGRAAVARAVNSSNQAVGVSFNSDNSALYATIWNDGVIKNLGALNNGNSQAYGINDAGQIVGHIDGRATLWNNGTTTDLGTLGGNHSIAWDINKSGQIVGYGTTINNASQQALLWTFNTNTSTYSPQALGTLGGNYSEAWAINDSGMIAGYSYDSMGHGHATLWSGGAIINLGAFVGGFSSDAQGINNKGQIVGYSSGNFVNPTHGNAHAILWDVSQNGIEVTDLIALVGGFEGLALDINDSGQIVGGVTYAGFNERHATLWNVSATGVVATDLNQFLDESYLYSGWRLQHAEGINNDGVIVGEAYNLFTSEYRPFMLTPVPEPQTFILLLAGLGLVGWMAQRRKQQSL